MIGDDDEKKYITIIKVSLICFFSLFVAIFITFFIVIENVDAQTNYNQSISINLNETSNNIDRIIYNDPNNTTKAFANVGRGTLVTIIMAYKYSDNTSFQIPTIYSVNARTDSGYSTCEVTSLSNVSDSTESNMKANMYGVKCDLNMGTNGLISLSANFAPQVNNTWTLQVGRLTFNNNIEAEQQSWLEYIHSYMQDWIYPKLTSIDNSTSSSEAYLSWIYAYMQNYVYTKLSDIANAISNGNQQIINNQNEIAEQQEENQKVCEKLTIDKDSIVENGYLDSQGIKNNSTNYGITDYIEIDSNIKVLKRNNNTTTYCFYNNEKTLIECKYNNTMVVGQNLNIPNNSKYIRLSIHKNNNEPIVELRTCKNGNQAINDSQQQINDTLNDSSVDDPSSDLSQMESQLPTNSTISDLLTLPVRLFQNVINAIDGTCSPFNLGSLYGTSIILPCINIQNIIGSNLYGVVDVILSGIFVLSIRKKFVDIFENLTSLKNGGNELE